MTEIHPEATSKNHGEKGDGELAVLVVILCGIDIRGKGERRREKREGEGRVRIVGEG